MFNKAKSTVLLLSGCLFASSITAQSYTIGQQVIGATAGSATLSGRQIDFTLGEPAILTLSSTANRHTLTQGFHQPETGIRVENPNSVSTLQEWGIEVFPNPTKEGLFIHHSTQANDLELQVEVLDARGLSVLAAKSLRDLSNEYLPCAELTAGYYLLRLHNRKESKTAIIPFIKIK